MIISFRVLLDMWDPLLIAEEILKKKIIFKFVVIVLCMLGQYMKFDGNLIVRIFSSTNDVVENNTYLHQSSMFIKAGIFQFH